MAELLPNDLVAKLRAHAGAWGVTAETADENVMNETAMARECARAAIEIEVLNGYLRNIELALSRREWEFACELAEIWSSRPTFPYEAQTALEVSK